MRIRLLAVLAASLAAPLFAQNNYVAPYVTDTDTLHLWHLNESLAPTADAGNNSFALQGLLNGASLGNPSASGFGTALNTDAGTSGQFGIFTLQPALANGSADDAPPTFEWHGADGAFTLEALVKLDVWPQDAPGSSLDIISMEGDNAERVFNLRIEKSITPSLSFIALPNSGISASALTFSIQIPLTGTNALTTNAWFHVAVTYNGDAGASDNLQFYWTRLDSGVPRAQLIGSDSLPADFGSTLGDFALGNEARATGGENEVFPGLIDEVRISGVARTPGDFVFHGVTIAGASGSDGNLPENTLDGDLGTRWSAFGDGQWISYDLGRAELVQSVQIAFYSGATRTSTFDVQVSMDNATWTTVLTNAVSSGATVNLESFDFTDTVGRYLRIVGHGNSQSDWNSLTEVQITRTGLGDSDGDGLPDAWEIQYFGSLSFGPGDDPDRDGYDNSVEFQAGSNPSDANSLPGDLNGNNLPDNWETNSFGGFVTSAYDDADGDGYNNLAEMIAGTNPTNSASHPGFVSPRVALLGDSILATNACLMPVSAPYGRAINGVSFQTRILAKFNGYEYTAWYDTTGSGTTTQTVWLARRAITNTSVSAWEKFNTGSRLVNGKSSWDAHNVISLGISPIDGTLHMSWDHHGNTLRYRRSVMGLCTTNTAAWGAGMLNAEQNWLVNSSSPIGNVTYPMFINTPTGALIFEYRIGSTSAGDHYLNTYNPGAGNWTPGIKFSAKEGTYTGVLANGNLGSSTSRNAYENNFDFAPDGTLHHTWTYREAADAANHDIYYAYSTNNGVTWLNNSGALVADTTLGQTMNVSSPGITMKVLDSRQRLINQQAQCVDKDGRVHVLMLHRRAEPDAAWSPGDSTFSVVDTAYFHYFRDPFTHVWQQRRIPWQQFPVGTRPKIGYDAQENVYAIYLSYASTNVNVVPGYTHGRLVIASASKASQYTDWEVVYSLTNDLNGEPLIDQARLLADNILSVFIQENSATTSLVGTPLHVFDFVANAPDSTSTTLSFLADDSVVTVASEPGYTYQLQVTPQLSPPDWHDVGPPVPGNGGLLALPHAGGSQLGHEYYRVTRTP